MAENRDNARGNDDRPTQDPASHIKNLPLEVDDAIEDNSDDDSAVTDWIARRSARLVRNSDAHGFVEENGRTFHRYKDGKYLLPNDEKEQIRLGLQHQVFLVMLDGRLNLAPINADLQHVLDVGTGTGVWAADFAEQYPSATVIGTDLSPIQPEFVPSNCHFEVNDAEDEWTFPHPFDLVHMRAMLTCFRDPKAILAKAYESLSPGGYLELQDGIFPIRSHDDTVTGTALEVWGKACIEAGKKMGREWTNTAYYKSWMEEIGFEDVHEKLFEIPNSTWAKGKKPKELAMWWQADLLEGGLDATAVAMTRVLGWEPEAVEKLFIDVRKDIKNKSIHGFMPAQVTYGRRPKGS